MTAHPLPPPGWYDDPAGSDRERYWEGRRWTRNLRERPAPVPVPERQSAPSGAEPAPSAPAEPHPWQGPPGTSYRMVRTTQDGVPLAGFGARALATVIDAVLMSLIGGLLGWNYLVRAWRSFQEVMSWSMQNPGQTPPVEQFDYVTPVTMVQFIILGISFVVQVVLVRWLGGTVGQLALGLRVVPAEHGRADRVSWQVSLMRSGVWLAVMAASQLVVFPVVVSYLRPLWHPRLQTWHDSVAHTQVITTRGPLARTVLRSGPTAEETRRMS